MDNQKKRKVSKNGPAIAPNVDNDQLGENEAAHISQGYGEAGGKPVGVKKKK